MVVSSGIDGCHPVRFLINDVSSMGDLSAGLILSGSVLNSGLMPSISHIMSRIDSIDTCLPEPILYALP